MSIQSFFNKIGQVSASELLEFLDHNQSEITIKIVNQHIKTNINSLKNNKHISLMKFSSYDFSNEPVICTFQVKEDRYFFKSHLSSTNIDYIVEVPSEIFQLQRRNDYRVSMPVGVVYKCEIRDVNGVKTTTKAEIRDMSLGGCQISVNGTVEIKQNDELDLYIKLDKFEFPKLPLTAKHIKFIEAQGTTLIGASYYQPSGTLIADLQSMLMHLDRVHRGKAKE
ncbi:PilZ domain-containing protein [bacterium]|nr:PilZ domain-containing protein [bacterium]